MDMEFYKNASYNAIGQPSANQQFEMPSIQSSDASSNLSSSSDGVSYLLTTSDEGESPVNGNPQINCEEQVPRPGVLKEIPVEKSCPVEKFYSSPDRLESTRCQLQFCKLQTEVDVSPPLPKALNS